MSGETLRHAEQRLAARYGADGPPKLLDADDLDSYDPADVEHWVKVYTELVEFTSGLLHGVPAGGGSASGAPVSGPAPLDRRALMLLVEVQQLHLTFWLDRLNGHRPESRRPG